MDLENVSCAKINYSDENPANHTTFFFFLRQTRFLIATVMLSCALLPTLSLFNIYVEQSIPASWLSAESPLS